MRSARPLSDLDQAHVRPFFAPRLTPGAIPSSGILAEPAYCLRVNAEWLGHVLGVLDALDQPDAWRGTATEIEDARNEVRKLIASIAECSPMELRQSPIAPCILQYSNDGGETWTDAFDYALCLDSVGFGTATESQLEDQVNTYVTNLNQTYNNNVWNIAPGMDYDGTARDEAREQALCNAINWLVQTVTASALAYEKEKFEKGMVVPKLAAIGLAAAAAVAVVITTPLTGGILFTAGGAAAGATCLAIWAALNEGDFGAFEDQDAIEDVVCYMFTSMSLTDPSETLFQSSLDGNSFTGNAAVIAASVSAVLDDLDTFLLFADYLQKSLDLIDAGAVLPCPCGIGWMIDHDLTLSDNGWQILVGGDGYDRARWISGLGFTSSTDNHIVYDEVRIMREWTVPATWTRVDLYFSNCRPIRNGFVQIPMGGDNLMFGSVSSPYQISLYKFGASIRVDMTIDREQLDCLYLERIVMRGIGDPPT